MFGIETITPHDIRATVADYKKKGMKDEDIEQMFKDALKVRYISIDVYYEAMKAIYEQEGV